VCAIALSVTSFYTGYAVSGDSGTGYRSQGKIIFNNNTESTDDDVIFDAVDFQRIDNMVTSGKSSVRDALNEYGSVDLGTGLPTFDLLASTVNSLTADTDATASQILYSKKALVGKDIITGTMSNFSNSVTQATTVEESDGGTDAIITIPSVGYYDGTSKISVPIETLKTNVSSLSSNIIHLEDPEITTRSITWYLTDYDDFRNFTIDNFLVCATGITYNFQMNIPSSGISIETGQSRNVTYIGTPTASYDSDKGQLVFTTGFETYNYGNHYFESHEYVSSAEAYLIP
jgi:hypothetical protein